MNNPLSRLLQWLHAGYPDGVPPKDYYPLLALLTRTLREDELHEIVATLIRENPDGDISSTDVEATIEQVKSAPPDPADVRDVAARLSSVGWPLGDPATAQDDDRAAPPAPDPVAPEGPETTGSTASSASRTGILQRVENWLSAGFPQGVPPTDRVPLMALLERRLTDEEVDEIARHLVLRADDEDESISSVDARTQIMARTHEVPTEQEIGRVASRLAAKGWPLEG